MKSLEFPKIAKIRQAFKGPKVQNISQEIAQQLDNINLKEKIKPGMKIAITAGSRGIANIPEIIRTTADEIKKLKAEPFIVPSMGSHGGATAEGQVEVLEGLGITEETCGCPIHSSMEVIQMGETAGGMPVYLDRIASKADGIILVGRVKPHTDFKAKIESGLLKMASIGLGKHAQALALHTHGIHGIRDIMPEVGRIVLQKAKILCGIAIVENAFEQTAILQAIPTENIEEEEANLLLKAADLMPSLPIQDIDILVVDEIGKNYSGTGMDTNIIGRIRIEGVPEPQSPRVKYLIACDLSEASHGNALGIGLADLTTRRLFEKIDFHAMNENVITSTFLDRAKIPIILENDRHALETTLRSNWGIESNQARLVRIANTLHIEEMYVSEAIYNEIKDLEGIEVVHEPKEIEFNEDGNFLHM